MLVILSCGAAVSTSCGHIQLLRMRHGVASIKCHAASSPRTGTQTVPRRQGLLSLYPTLKAPKIQPSTRAAARGGSRLTAANNWPFEAARGAVIMAGGARGPIENKTVVVTGGGRGIGFEFVKQFVERGNLVFATVRSTSAASKLKDLGENVTVIIMDVTDSDSIEKFAKTIRDETDHVDVVINNAGILIYSAIDSVSAEDMMKSFQVNTVGPLMVVQALLRNSLLGGKQPSIIGNITSKVGSNADNRSGGGYAYRASKAALNIVTTSLSMDLKNMDVASVMLHPGWVRTDMTGGNGLIDAKESAGGLIGVLESALPLNGKWWDYKSEEIPF